MTKFRARLFLTLTGVGLFLVALGAGAPFMTP